jgi:hypothetical protein
MSTQSIATQKIQQSAIIHYGNLISTEDPIFDEKERLWKAQLKSNYPRLIKNDYPQEERFIRVLPLKGLGTICLNENFQFVKECSVKREESISLIRSYLEMWREQVEHIIVEASALQLAKTSPARVFLNPANMILANFLQREDVIISFEELEKLRSRRTQLDRWLALLEDLNLIKRIDNGYTYGDMFTALRAKTSNDKEFEVLSMAYILKKSYPMLKGIFHIQQFEPLVHLDTCYYRPALEAETVLYQTSASLFRRFAMDYRYRPHVELRHVLNELNNSEALLCKKSYYYANDELFKDMLNLKTQVPEMALPRA